MGRSSAVVGEFGYTGDLTADSSRGVNGYIARGVPGSASLVFDYLQTEAVAIGESSMAAAGVDKRRCPLNEYLFFFLLLEQFGELGKGGHRVPIIRRLSTFALFAHIRHMHFPACFHVIRVDLHYGLE